MSSSCPSPHLRFSVEFRPKLLKDFLQDDSPSYNPQKICIKSATSQGVSNKITSSQLLRSRSSRAAISAIHKVMNIVKSLPFVSRRNYKENDNYIMKHEVVGTVKIKIKVKVKDILRWKSPRYLAEEKSTSFDHTYSPYKCIATRTTTSTATSSQRSSWCDSDFTAEDLRCYRGEINIEESCVGGNCFMGETRGIKLDPKEHICFDEIEQQSPVSVLESPFREDHRKNVWSCKESKSLRSLQKKTVSLKRRIMKKNKNKKCTCEIIEEKTKKILSQLKETRNLCMEDCETNLDDQLLFDFFLHELIQNNVDESEMLIREAKSWINGEYNGEFEWEMEDKREAYIRDMQRVGRWNNFEEEKEELILNLEFELFNNLVHEILIDLFALNCLKN